MKSIADAIAERRELLATIAAEIAQLEGAAQLVGELLTNVPRPGAREAPPPCCAEGEVGAR